MTPVTITTSTSGCVALISWSRAILMTEIAQPLRQDFTDHALVVDDQQVRGLHCRVGASAAGGRHLVWTLWGKGAGR